MGMIGDYDVMQINISYSIMSLTRVCLPDYMLLSWTSRLRVW